VLISLQLTNFRKCTDATTTFLPGMNVLRGSNEVGKSTKIQAIMYAFFGARALPEPLSEVVTYGQPVTTLKVVLVFRLNGEQYTLTRHKGGAELSCPSATVSGQLGVTQRMEELLGGSGELVAKLAFASQNDIRGALTSGSAAATALIESLSNLSVLDDVVTALQTRTLNGNVGVLQSLIGQHEAQASVSPVQPTYNPSPEVQLHAATVTVEDLQAQLAALDLANANNTLAEARAASTQRERAEKEQARLQAMVAAGAPTWSCSTEQVDAWRQALDQNRHNARLVQQHNLLKSYSYTGPLWEGTLEAFEEAARTEQTLSVQLNTEVRRLELELVRQRTLLITEKTCGLCRKDLSDVPEVVTVNASISAKIGETKQALSIASQKLADTLEACSSYAKIKSEIANVRQQFAAEFFNFTSDVPPKPVWAGEEPLPADGTDYAGLIREAEAGLLKVQRAEADLAAAKRSLSQLVLPAVPDTTEAKAVLVKAAGLQASLQAATEVKSQHAKELATAREAYAAALATYEAEVKAKAAAKEHLSAIQENMKTMLANNDLIRKVRAARPVVANKLWATVTSAISHYFTQIRGEHSVVTRTSEGFLVNGRGIGGLSGSTLDSLGLAVRAALVKTFMPNLRVLILDEPAAGCDTERETAMLGMVAGLDTDQVLLVTHSDLADTFASQVIQL